MALICFVEMNPISFDQTWIHVKQAVKICR